MAAKTSVIALAWPLRRALGGGSAGIGPAHTMEAVMSKTQSPTTKLSDTQLVILAAAAQRADHSLLPFPESLTVKGAALNKVVDTLCKRKLAEERRTINGAPEWRRDEDGRPLGLFITTNGLLALGVEDAENEGTLAGGRKHAPPTQDGSRTAAGKARTASPASTKRRAAPSQSKQDLVIQMLRRQSGVSIDDIIAKTGWQPHSVRGFFSGLVRKKLKLPLVSDVGKDGVRRYHIAPIASSKA